MSVAQGYQPDHTTMSIRKPVFVLLNRGFLEWEPGMRAIPKDGHRTEEHAVRLLSYADGKWRCFIESRGGWITDDFTLDDYIPDVLDGGTGGLFATQAAARYPGIEFDTSVDEQGIVCWIAEHGDETWSGHSLGEVAVRAIVWMRSGEEDAGKEPL